MRFGNCKECKQYKYLESEGSCPTCAEAEENWMVVHASYHAFTYTQIIEDGLTKKEAKEMAGKNKMYVACKESEMK